MAAVPGFQSFSRSNQGTRIGSGDSEIQLTGGTRSPGPNAAPRRDPLREAMEARDSFRGGANLSPIARGGNLLTPLAKHFNRGVGSLPGFGSQNLLSSNPSTDSQFNLGFDDLGRAIFEDRDRLQDLLNERVSELKDVEGRFDQGLTDAASRTRETGVGAASRLEEFVGDMRGRFDEREESIVGGLTDLSAQQAMTQVLGVNKAAHARLRQVDTDPDLTAAQKVAAKQRIRQESAELSTNAVATSGVQFQSLMAQTRTALSGQSVQLDASAGNLLAAAQQLRVASEAAANNYEVNGLVTLSNMIRNRPYSHVSIATGIAQMIAAQSAGGGGFGGIPLDGGATNRGSSQSRGAPGVAPSPFSTPPSTTEDPNNPEAVTTPDNNLIGQRIRDAIRNAPVIP
jgi:hypothetical protein